MVSSTGRFPIYLFVLWQLKRSIFRLRLWSPCRRSFPFSLARAQIPLFPSLFNPCHAGYSQSEVIVDAKVSDRQRRRCAPCRNIIGCKSSFTCHVLLGFCFLSCWMQFNVSFAEIFRRTEVVFIVVLHTVMVQKALLRNSPVRWPFTMQLMHILSCQLDLSNRPRLVKSSIPNFKIKTANWSLRQKD